MKTYLPLIFVGLIPVTATALLYWLDKKVLNKLNYWFKQILFGIIFGGIAVLGTEYSIPISGVGMNVRDAAPICAGLFFGAPAGIIAGLIGGIERWFAVYWGAGELTRLACSLATIASGVIAALFRKLIFNNKEAKFAYGIALGIIAETLHMLLVILTNMDNVNAAFSVVETCTIPMVCGVALSVGISSLIVSLINRSSKKYEEELQIDISTTFQKSLLILMTIAFCLTNGFCVALQKSLAYQQSENLLLYNLEDCVSEIDQTVNSQMISTARLVATDIEDFQDNGEEITTAKLNELCNYYNVTEICLIGNNNIIYASSNIAYLGYDMTSASQSVAFAEAFSDFNTRYYIQEMQSSGYNQQNIRKYCGYRNDNGGYIQISYDIDTLTENTKETLTLLGHSRRIGQSGSMIIANRSTGLVISDFNSTLTGKTLEELGLDIDTSKNDMSTVYHKAINGVDTYYSYYLSEGYIIISMLPAEEVTYNEYLSVYLMSFVEIAVFASIFIITYFLIKNSIVKNIKIINNDLAKITSGNLNTVVNVRQTEEFSTLSDHINTTVSKLKDLISESERRMKDDLNYAAQIQHSSLPMNFPERPEFDLYASMDPAKSVGGDFYDFYMLDDHRLCILIADVSGKGIPASLFMMRAKTVIKAYAEYGFEVNDIFTDTNYELTQGNDAGLFVTSWIGILDLKTGHMNYANAGHNPPLIRHPNQDYEYLPSKPGFVLGGMEGIVYKKFEMDIEEGSSIFIYTDGLTEAQNINKELYGEPRLLASINRYKDLSSKDICFNVKKDIVEFQGEADQFDDMTMLCLKFNKKI